MESMKPEMCSVIVPMHQTIGQYGGLMLSLEASATSSEVEDRCTYVLRLIIMLREH